MADASDALGIRAALAKAHAGDTIEVPPGQYLGPLQLKDGVDLVSAVPGKALVRSDPTATADAGIGIVANGSHTGRLRGFVISGDQTHPLRIGIDINGSPVEIEETEVSGAIEAGIRIGGAIESGAACQLYSRKRRSRCTDTGFELAPPGRESDLG